MAARSGNQICETFTAGADLSAKQFYLVELTAAGVVNVCNAVTDEIVGVLQNKPKSGEAAEVCVFGGSLIYTDGTSAIAAGDHIGTDTSGRGIKCTTADRPCIAISQGASTATGTIISGWVRPHAFRTPA